MTPLTDEQRRNSGDACKKCRAAIVWARTPAGKDIPIDVEPAFGGNIELAGDADGLLAATIHRPDGNVERYVAHFTSCSDPAGFRNKPVPAPADEQAPTHEEQELRRAAAGKRVLPFGQFAGEYLDDVVQVPRGKRYLEWFYDTVNPRDPTLKEAVGIVLGLTQ